MTKIQTTVNPLAPDDTQLEHLCFLDFETPLPNRRLTGSVYTIDKTCRSPEVLEKLIMGGMNIARVCFARDSHDYHDQTFEMIRTAAEKCSQTLGYHRPVALALETKGPEVRKEYLPDEERPVEDMLVTTKDIFDLRFGVDQRVDFVFISATRSAEAIRMVQVALGKSGKDIKIIAKLESLQGLQHLDEIIDVADGVLMDRADIGLDLPPARVLLVQKAVIARCNRKGKPVICTTSMISTAAEQTSLRLLEAADIFNVILDGADCLLLASDATTGAQHVQTLNNVASVCREAEAAVWHRRIFDDLVRDAPTIMDAAFATALSAVETARKCQATAIVVLTASGRTAQLVSRFRPTCPIVAVSRCARTTRICHLYRGIVPLLYNEPVSGDDWLKDVDDRVQYALNVTNKMGFVNMGDAIVIISPWKDGIGFTNNMHIAYAFFEVETMECLLKQDAKINQALASNPPTK